MNIRLNRQGAVMAGATAALLIGVTFGSVLRPNCDAAEYSAGPRLDLGRTKANQSPPDMGAYLDAPLAAAAAPPPIVLANQDVRPAPPRDQLEPPALQLADNDNGSDSSDPVQGEDPSIAGPPAPYEADHSDVDRTEDPATDKAPD